MEVLAGLPEEQREAFGFVHIDGLSIPQAAQVLDVRRGAVSLRVHRACKALREQLGDEVREWLENRR
jgi:DNA-directed RNA polymerase specialized sigma24 family protein